MGSVDTWKWVITLQLGTAIPAISFSYVLPHAPEFVQEEAKHLWGPVGFWLGCFVGSYSLGRAIGTPLWMCLSPFCGRRPVLQICLLAQFFLTLCFGLSGQLLMAISFRFGIGFFASGYALACPILRDVLTRDRGKAPAASVVTVTFLSAMHVSGLILGTLMIKNEEMPYLEASLIDVILLLLSFVVISTDFPEFPAPKRKASVETVQKPKKVTPKPQQKSDHNGKFEQFNGEEMRNSLDTREKEEDEVPSYLEHFASPAFPQLSVLKGVIGPDAEITSMHEGELTIDSGSREPDGHPTSDMTVKRTHISFVEEELKDATAKFEEMDDPFHTQGRVSSLQSCRYCLHLCIFLYLTFLCAAIEFASWYSLSSRMDTGIAGIVLAGSAGGTLLLQSGLASKAAERWPMNRAGVVAAGTAAVIAAIIPTTASLQSDFSFCALAIILLCMRDSFLRLTQTLCVLRLSACVTCDLRSSALSVADELGALAKGVGIVCGPSFVVWVDYTDFPLREVLGGSAAVCLLVAAGLLAATRKHFPLLQQAPYKI